MSKLIYAPSSSIIEGTYSGIKDSDQAVNSVYSSIAFTGDGYMYTHGKKFRLFLVQQEGLTGISFQITNGTASVLIDGTSVGNGTVVQTITGDSIIDASTNNGVTTLTHASFYQQPQQIGSATAVPVLTIDNYGHITAVSSASVDTTKVLASAVTNDTNVNYYLVGVNNNEAQNPKYTSNVYIDQDGNLHVGTVYQGNSTLSQLYAPYSHQSVQATASTLGHVYLWDTIDAEKDQDDSYAATPKAVASALASSQEYTRNLVAAQDAMVFAGTITYDGTITSHNSDLLPGVEDNSTTIQDITYKIGYTFRFISSGKFGQEDVEVGDMLIAVRHKSNGTFVDTDFTIIQTNITGALTANTNLSGLLYADGSRVVNALSFTSGVLTYSDNTLAFANPNTIWRTIKVNDTSIGNYELDLRTAGNLSYSNANGVVTLSLNENGLLASAGDLTFKYSNTEVKYKPDNNKTIYVGEGLSIDEIRQDDVPYSRIRHAAGTSLSNRFGRITTDAYGHITSIQDVTSLPNANSFIVKDNAGESLLSYNGDEVDKILKFVNGTDVTFTLAVEELTPNELTITPSITHRYRPVSFYAQSDSQSSIPLLNNSETQALTLVAGNNISLTHQGENGANLDTGFLVINAEDTWRDIQVYRFSGNSFVQTSIGNSVLKFDNSLIIDTNNEIGIGWTEIDANGNVTYVK